MRIPTDGIFENDKGSPVQTAMRNCARDEGRSFEAGGLYLFDTSTAAIETIPTLQHDPDNPEDLLKCATDHAADALRYLCMSRPWTGISGEEAERREQDIRNRIPPEPEEFVLVAQPDGILKANYCMWHVVNRRMREKRMRGSNGMDAKHSLLDSNHKQRNVAWRCPSG